MHLNDKDLFLEEYRYHVILLYLRFMSKFLALKTTLIYSQSELLLTRKRYDHINKINMRDNHYKQARRNVDGLRFSEIDPNKLGELSCIA